MNSAMLRIGVLLTGAVAWARAFAPVASAFGSWTLDGYNPAFCFTGGTANSTGAVSPTLRSLLHHAGNDRVCALAYADGSLALRQDEGGPKSLNAYDPTTAQYGGALGYVTDETGALLLPTVFNTTVGTARQQGDCYITLGMGYVTKHARTSSPLSISVDHSVLAPFGDDSAVLSIASVSGPAGVSLRFTDVWAAARTEWNVPGLQAPVTHNITVLIDAQGRAIGLLDRPSPASLSAPSPSLHDPAPRPAFIACLTCTDGLASYTSSGLSLFQVNASAMTPYPAPLARGLDNDTSTRDSSATLALQAAFTIPASGVAEVAFLYGYVKPEDDVDVEAAVYASIASYTATWQSAWNDTANAWAISGGVLAPGQMLDVDTLLEGGAPAMQEMYKAVETSWEALESHWHSHMLRSGLTYDSFYNNHILNQNGHYLYVDGIQGAARDPAAHIMALLFYGPEPAQYVREVVNYTLSSKRTAVGSAGQPIGSIPWGQQAFGMDGSGGFNPSDLENNLLFTVSTYVLSTRDMTWMDGEISCNGTTLTIADSLWQSFEHLVTSIGVGVHGLLRIQHMDHNDGLLGTLGIEGANATYAIVYGESVMNTALAVYVLPMYADVLRLRGEPAQEAMVREFVANLSTALQAQYVPGKWFRRVYLGNDTLGWRGDPNVDGIMWTETQSWALLSGVPTAMNISNDLVNELNAISRNPSPLGAINAAPFLMTDEGYGYGGIWYCGNLAMISAFALRGFSDLALEEWRKNSLTMHTLQYPNIWFGVTSGPDVYNSVLSNHPGSTRCDYSGPGMQPPCRELAVPVLNMWSHTLPAFTVPLLSGFEATADVIILRPGITSESVYTIYTPLVSVQRSNTTACNLNGHYAPFVPVGTNITMRLELLPADAAACSTLVVNAVSVPCAPQSNGFVTFSALTVAGFTSGTSIVQWQLS